MEEQKKKNLKGILIAVLAILAIPALVSGLFLLITLIGIKEDQGRSALMKETQVLISTKELEEAPDGNYLIYAMLRGDSYFLDDNGRGIIYLEKHYSDKNGHMTESRVYTADRFYLDDLELPQKPLWKEYLPQVHVTKKYGSSYKYYGLKQCELGTFEVTKLDGTLKKVKFYDHYKPEFLLSSYDDTSKNWESFWEDMRIAGMVFGGIALGIVALVGGIWLYLKLKAGKCPVCGTRLKVDGKCPSCSYCAPKKSEAAVSPQKSGTAAKQPANGNFIYFHIAFLCVLVVVYGVLKWKTMQEVPNPYAAEWTSETRENPYAYFDQTDFLEYFYEYGAEYETELPSGFYIVGVHMPEGPYAAETYAPYDGVNVMCQDYQIFLCEYQQREDNVLQDIRLMSGALVKLDTATKIKLHADHAVSTDSLYSIPNPVTESVKLECGRTYTAGADFQPGVYDLLMDDGDKEICLDVYNVKGEFVYQYTYSKYRQGEETFANLVIPENSRFVIEGEGGVTLVPSEKILSTYYDGFYELYGSVM